MGGSCQKMKTLGYLVCWIVLEGTAAGCTAGQMLGADWSDGQQGFACHPRTYYSLGYDSVTVCKSSCLLDDSCAGANYDTDGGCYHCEDGYSVITHNGADNSGTLYGTDCTNCPSGTWSNANDASCSPTAACPAGYYCPTSGSVAVPCATGTFSSTVGATSEDTCESCGAGGSSEPESTVCTGVPSEASTTATPTTAAPTTAAPTAAAASTTPAPTTTAPTNAAPTNLPTSPVLSYVALSQQIVFSALASEWVSTLKSLGEAAYAHSTNIWNAETNTFKSGYHVTSSASRRSCTVTFTTTVPQASESAFRQAAAAVTPSGMSTSAGIIQSNEAGTYGGVEPPQALSVVPIQDFDTSNASSTLSMVMGGQGAIRCLFLASITSIAIMYFIFYF